MEDKESFLRSSSGLEGNTEEFFALAREYVKDGQLKLAAIAFDRAFGLDSTNKDIIQSRKYNLDQLEVIENRIRFRYIPAGSFLMGSESGQPNEKPVHSVEVDGFWLSETPISWATYCHLMKWQDPPIGRPENYDDFPGEGSMKEFFLHQENKIRLQYCEDQTQRARDWHAHDQNLTLTKGDGTSVEPATLFGKPDRESSNSIAYRYSTKPMISVSWQEVELLCNNLNTEKIKYNLPTEAEWEKAARGGLINKKYPWGDEPPNALRCDFDHFGKYNVEPVIIYPPNAYGLYGMAGSVWEWTRDTYNANYYQLNSVKNPLSSSEGELDSTKVLRGGSWADESDIVTCSIRMTRNSNPFWFRMGWGGHMTPNIGFRLARYENK